VFLKTLDGIRQHCEHEFFFGIHVTLLTEDFEELVRRQHIRLGKRIGIDRPARRRCVCSAHHNLPSRTVEQEQNQRKKLRSDGNLWERKDDCAVFVQGFACANFTQGRGILGMCYDYAHRSERQIMSP
jgi:hypothetical protein